MLRKNLIKIGIPLAAVAALAGGMVMPVSAASTTTTTATTPATAALHTVQGTVTAISGTTSFTIQDANKTSVTVNVGTNTKYYMVSIGRVQADITGMVTKDRKQDNGKQSVTGAMNELHIPANWKDNLDWLETFKNTAKFTDIAVGDRIVARVDNNNLAAQVLIVKGQTIKEAKGIITISGNTLTVATSPTTTISLTWGSNTEFIMKGVITAPSGTYGAVTYNSTTNTADLVNFTVKAPTSPTTTTTTH
jgi:hypothetical protein